MELMQRRRELMAMQSELPSAYRRVEYLHSDAGQYIATSYVPIIGDEIETTFSFVETAYTRAVFSAGTGSYQLILVYQTSIWWKYFQAGNAASSNVPITTNNWYTLSVKKVTGNGVLYLNGREIASSAAGNELDGANTTLWLFRRRNNSSAMLGKICRFTITNNGVKKLDLIPCVRKSDSKPGMYDTVSKTFYTNAGTGEFIVPA